MSGDPVSHVPPAHRDPAWRHDPARGHGHRPARETRSSGQVRRTATVDAHGLSVTVSQVMSMIEDRRSPLDTMTTREVIARLRYFAHDAPHPSLRAAIHVACAFLSAGDLDEARLALSSAADHL